MSAKYKSPSFLLPNELNTSANPANDTGVNSLYSMDFGTAADNGINCGPVPTMFIGDSSVSIWFKSEVANSSNVIFNRHTAGSGNFNDTYTIRTELSGSGVKIKLELGNPLKSFYSQNVYSKSVWHHLAVTLSYSGGQYTVKFYVDGVEDSPTNSPITMPAMSSNSTLPLTIGALRSGSNFIQGCRGELDEVAIFNRALNTTEIAALYDGSGSNIRPSNLMATDLNPIAYYPLGEQAQMQGYLGYEASSEWQFPNGVLQDYVMDFDSTSPGDYVSLGDLTTVESNEFTISMWVNKDNIATNSVLFNSGTAAAPNDSVIFQHTGSTFYIGVGGAGGLTLPAGLSSGVWYNFILTVNGTTAKVYIDGSQFGSNITVGSVRTGIGSEAVLGKYNFGTFANLDGKMSNVAIWNTDQSANIANIYNNGSPQTTYTVTPQNWWKLNADSVYTPSAPNYTKALDFTGTQHIKSVGTRSFNNFSISFWFNTATTPSAFEGYVSGQTGTGNDYSLGGFSIYYYNGGLALQSSNVNFNLSFTNNIILGNWNHIVVDIDNSNSSTGGKLYLNGQLALETTNSGAYTYNFNNLWIGSRSTSGGNATNLLSDSKISNVSVFNSNLTASQVSTLFNFGTPETITSFSPYNHYKLNNNTTGIQDSGSAGNNAVITGTLNSVNSSVAVVPSWKISSALTIPTINYKTAGSFNGTSSKVSIASTSLGTSNTVSFWFYHNSSGSTFGTLVGGSTATNPGLRGGEAFSIGGTGVYCSFDAARFSWNNPWYATGNLKSDNWNHVVFVRDASKADADKIQLSINNSTLTSYDTINFATPNFSTQTNIANSIGQSFFNGQAFDGFISNVSTFTTAFTQAQVNTLYNNGQPSADISSLSPVNWWKLDTIGATITDNGSAGNNGTNTDVTAATTDVKTSYLNIPVNGVSTTLPSTALQQSDLQFDSPYSNYSLYFDGTTGIQCGDIPQLNSATKLSFNVWLNYENMDFRIIFSKEDSTNAIRLYNWGSGILYFWLKNSGIGTVSFVNNFSSLVSLNEWNMLTVVYDGTQTSNNDRVKIFLNGGSSNILTDYGTIPTSTGNITDSFAIGEYSSVSGNRFLGKLDETSIFNTALTSAEILEIYNNGRPKDLTTFSGTAPISWWRLGENAYFQDSTLVLPNSIIGAPNGEAATNNLEMISADAPGTYANGIGTNLDILDRVGDAPLSTSNSQSYNMIPDNKSPYVPAYVGLQTDNIYSMDFDAASNTYFNAGNPTELQITGDITVSAWFKTSNSGSAITIAGRGAHYSSSLSSWALFRRSNNGLAVQLRVGNAFIYALSPSTTYNDGNWHHVCFTRETSSGDLKLYIDGSLSVTTTGVTGVMQNETKETWIGGATDGYYFDGQIDEVAIWDTALNAGQIFNDLYQPTATATNKTADLVNNPNLPNPVAWYRMGD